MAILLFFFFFFGGGGFITLMGQLIRLSISSFAKFHVSICQIAGVLVFYHLTLIQDHNDHQLNES